MSAAATSAGIVIGAAVKLYGGSGTGIVTYVSGKRKNAKVLKDTGYESWVAFHNLKVVAA